MAARDWLKRIIYAIPSGIITLASLKDLFGFPQLPSGQIMSNYVLLAVAGVFAFPIWIAYQIGLWRNRKQKPTEPTPIVGDLTKPTSVLERLDRTELTTRAMLGYRGLLKLDLLEIGPQLDSVKQLQFHSWNNTQPDLKKQIIGDDDLYNALQAFSSALNERNTSVGKLDFEIWNNSCKNHYDRLKQMGFVNAPSPIELNRIEAYDYQDLVAQYPWVRLLPQAKQEIIVLGAACESISHHTDFLKQLLEANKDLTISCALVNTDNTIFMKELEKEKGWIGLRKSAEASLERLKAAKGQISEDLRNRFAVEAYEVVPPFNMVVLDPQTENAYMQVGYYPTGIDQNYRISIVFHKKDKRTVFLKYWNEYKSYRQTHSSVGY